MKRRIYKKLAKFALQFHNYFYKVVTKLAILAEGGLHPKHRLIGYHKFFVDNVSSEETVLDIGCGNGALSCDLAKKAKKVIAVDLSERNIEIAKKEYFNPNIEYEIGDATRFDFKKRADIIVLSNVLEHIKDRVEFLKKIKELAPRILIRVPMINRDWLALYKKEIGIEYRLDKTHFIEYTLESFKEEVERAGLKVEKYSIQFGEIWSVVE